MATLMLHLYDEDLEGWIDFNRRDKYNGKLLFFTLSIPIGERIVNDLKQLLEAFIILE